MAKNNNKITQQYIHFMDHDLNLYCSKFVPASECDCGLKIPAPAILSIEETIAGNIDRGPLAGPVGAAGIVMPQPMFCLPD